MPMIELENVNGQLDEYDVELDGLGRVRVRGVGRRLRRQAKIAKRIERLRERGARVGRANAIAQQYRLPDGRVVCPSPSDLILLSDEPMHDIVNLTDLSTWPQDQAFFNTHTRASDGPAITNLLRAGQANYDMDIESLAVQFHAIDAGSAAINADQQTLLEILGRGVLEYRVEEKTNVLWPVADCPAGSGTFNAVNTTQNNMRTLSIQNGHPGKGRRMLTQRLPVRRTTAYSDHLHVSAADRALITGLTNDPTRSLGVRVLHYGPEGVPVIPAGAGGLLQAQGTVG
jgi:hypothetical protein